MSKMWKRIIATALIGVMTLSLVACSKSDSSSEKEESGTEELEVWLPATAEDGNDAELWADIVADFEEEHNCKVNFQFISWKDYEAKFSSAISTGTGPDVARMYVEMYPTYIDAGAVEDLTDYLTDEDYDTYTVLTEKYQIFGKHYGVAISGPSSSVSMVYNKDILDAIGEDVPKNWDDVIRVAQKATQDTDGDGTIDQYGIAQGWGQNFYQDLNFNYYSFLWQAGGDVFDAQTGECLLDSEAGIASAQFLYDLKNTYKVLPEDTMSLINAEAFENYFLSGKAALAFVSLGTGNLNLLDEAGINYGFDITLQGPNGDQGFWTAADQLALMSAAENKELAWEFIKYVTGPEGGPKMHEMDHSAPCTNTGEPYYASEVTREMMEEYGPTCTRPLTAARRATEVYDYLWKDIQSMMNGDLTPEAAMKDVAEYANALDYSDPNAN